MGTKSGRLPRKAGDLTGLIVMSGLELSMSDNNSAILFFSDWQFMLMIF